jgi:hypothetical protein
VSKLPTVKVQRSRDADNGNAFRDEKFVAAE